jgi:hypothetical protein
MLSAALAYLAAGFSLFPLAPESKLPLGPWKSYQDAPPTTSQLVQWFGNTGNNIALLMGRISGGVFSLDFDDVRLARLVFDLEDLSRRTLVQTTPRPGVHVVFRSEGDESVKSTTYARRGMPLDVKGQGGYIVAAPSSLHHGAVYRRLSPDLQVATVSREWLEALVIRLRTRWLQVPRLSIQSRFGHDGEARLPEDP